MKPRATKPEKKETAINKATSLGSAKPQRKSKVMKSVGGGSHFIRP